MNHWQLLNNKHKHENYYSLRTQKLLGNAIWHKISSTMSSYLTGDNKYYSGCFGSLICLNSFCVIISRQLLCLITVGDLLVLHIMYLCYIHCKKTIKINTESINTNMPSLKTALTSNYLNYNNLSIIKSYHFT